MRDNFDEYLETISGGIPEAPPVYKEPDTKTVLVDIDPEEKKTYTPDEKAFEKRKEEGFSLGPPVDIYEPGFRSEVYEALVNYFKGKREQKAHFEELKKKMGWRS